MAHHKNREHWGTGQSLLCYLCPHKCSRDDSLHPLSSSPHSNTWSPEPLPWAKRPSPSSFMLLRFLFSRPDFGRNPSISYFLSWTHEHTEALFWVLLLLWSSVLFQFLLSLYISWAPTVMKNQDKCNLFYISVFILYREIYSVYVGCAYCSTFITCQKLMH